MLDKITSPIEIINYSWLEIFAGVGDQWKAEWDALPGKYFQPAVIDYFNQTMDGKITGTLDATANYLATVKTLNIKTGTMAGPMTKQAVVNVQVIFTRIGTSEVLATVEIKKAKTNGFNWKVYAMTGDRIGSAYSYVGQNLAVAVPKAIN